MELHARRWFLDLAYSQLMGCCPLQQTAEAAQCVCDLKTLKEAAAPPTPPDPSMQVGGMALGIWVFAGLLISVSHYPCPASRLQGVPWAAV